MNRVFLVFLLCCSSLLFAQSPNRNPNKNEPPILGPHWTRGQAKTQPASTSNDLIYHGGPILPGVTTTVIFWGSSWGNYNGDKITGMDKWYSHVGTVSGGSGSSYEATVNEYTDSSGHQVSTAVTYGGVITDASSLPKHLSTSAVLSEVCKVIGRTLSPTATIPCTWTANAEAPITAPTIAGARAAARRWSSASSSILTAMPGATRRAQ